LRNWRLSNPVEHYRSIRKEFDAAGIVIFTYYVNINDSYTDAEVDAVFDGAKILGAKGCVGSQGLKLSQWLSRFPGRHGMVAGADPPAANRGNRKETYVMFGCAYCHGVTLTPRGEAADLMHSALVGADTNGDAIAALLRAGVPKTSKLSPMPQFSDLSDRQLHDIARYIHYARQQGRYHELLEAKAEPGDGAAGKTYFDQNCAACHAADLNSIGRRHDAIALREQLLRPRTLNEPPSFAVSALGDNKVATARQRHNFLLENFTPAQVANLVAYLQSR
jgi:mono/diheme cytochrome c family protein